MYLAAIIGAVILLLFLYQKVTGKKYKLPPGPAGLPFVGVIHKLDPTGSHKTFTEWSEQYGDVYRVKLMGADVVVLNSYETIYDILVTRSNDFSGRPKSLFFRMDTLHDYADNIIMSQSKRWKAMKKLAMQSLKMYGNNLKTLETITLELTGELNKSLKSFAATGEAVDPKPLFNYLTSSIILSILYGRKLEEKRLKEFLEHQENSQVVFAFDAAGHALDLWPFLRHFPLKKRFEGVLNFRKQFLNTFEQEYPTSQKAYEPGKPKCFIDALLDYKNKLTKNDPELELTDRDIYSIKMDMINAGTLTTSFTLNTLLAVLVNKPSIQQKMADDIEAVIGDCPPSLGDRPALPYVEAAIFETLRYHSQLPLNLAHCPIRDMVISGYDIPKDTWIYCNLWKIHHEEKLWDAPWEFRPERFLDENGELLPVDHPNRRHVLAFGAGRRVCVGEVLAKNRLFLVVTSLLQNFRFLPESDERRPLHNPNDFNSGAMIFPKSYKVRVSRRR